MIKKMSNIFFMNSDDLDDNDGENEYQAKIAGNPCKIHVSSCHFHCPLSSWFFVGHIPY